MAKTRHAAQTLKERDEEEKRTREENKNVGAASSEVELAWRAQLPQMKAV